MPGQDGAPEKIKMTGEQLAAAMVEQLTILNQQIASQIQVISEHNELVDTLCGHFDVLHLAMDMAKGLKGKQKITIVDFAECWVEAADEILPEEDENEGDVLTPQRM